MAKSCLQLTIYLPIIALVSAILCLLGHVGVILWITVLCILGFVFFFYPIAESIDVSKRIPEIAQAKKENKALAKVYMRHQYFWGIVAVNVLFGATLIGWVIAFIMAHTPCDADVPPEFEEILQPKKQSMEEQLSAVQALVSKGVITEQEGQLRRETIIKNI